MSKLLPCASLFVIALLVACSGSTPTPVPTATLAPTVAPSPSPAPSPSSIPGPAEEVLSPLSTTDSEAFLSEVSSVEQACISENVDPDRITSLLAAPDLAAGEDEASLIGCLADETLLRLFLSPFLNATGPLSAESSVCVRDVFAGTDLVAMMVGSLAEPGASEAAGAAMVGLMVGFFSGLACLNEAEFQAASPALELGSTDRQDLQCLLDQLGGPEGLAALMQPDAGPPLALFGAAVTCNLSLSP